MDLLRATRIELMERLWHRFTREVAHASLLEKALKTKVGSIHLDHLAIIDLPSAHSGIHALETVFAIIGYETKGEGYLPEKNNGFIWMAEEGAADLDARQALPQIVLADFRMFDCSREAQNIIRRLTETTAPVPTERLMSLAAAVRDGSTDAKNRLLSWFDTYLFGRSHERPTRKEAEILMAENELLAWTALFPRAVNHFGISAHLMNGVLSFEDLLKWVGDQRFQLNSRGGKFIKGSIETGIEQAATVSQEIHARLEGGNITVPDRFIELVWRHSQDAFTMHPVRWTEFFTGFVSKNADRIIESLYEDKKVVEKAVS